LVLLVVLAPTERPVAGFWFASRLPFLGHRVKCWFLYARSKCCSILRQWQSGSVCAETLWYKPIELVCGL